MEPLLIFNIFPRLYNSPDEWNEKLGDISQMGFNAVFVNNIYKTDSSRCLYAISDYYKLNKDLFSKNKDEFEQLDFFIDNSHNKNIKVILDITISSISLESSIAIDNPEWLIKSDNNSFAHPSSWISGHYQEKTNLGILDYENEKNIGLWEYIREIILFYLNKGIDGVRFESAYRMPNKFWNFLINEIKIKHPDSILIGETLGCTPIHIKSLVQTGFDYIYNSSKWWDYSEPWCIEQYELTREFVPSISFPDNHDTTRYPIKDIITESEHIRKLYFAGVFSGSMLITSGFEFGYSKDLNTILTTPEDHENTGYDFRNHIKKIISIKKKLKTLSTESKISLPPHSNPTDVLFMVKSCEEGITIILLNKSATNEKETRIYDIKAIIGDAQLKEVSPEIKDRGIETDLFKLDPAEVRIFTTEVYI